MVNTSFVADEEDIHPDDPLHELKTRAKIVNAKSTFSCFISVGGFMSENHLLDDKILILVKTKIRLFYL